VLFENYDSPPNPPRGALKLSVFWQVPLGGFRGKKLNEIFFDNLQGGDFLKFRKMKVIENISY